MSGDNDRKLHMLPSFEEKARELHDRVGHLVEPNLVLWERQFLLHDDASWEDFYTIARSLRLYETKADIFERYEAKYGTITSPSDILARIHFMSENAGNPNDETIIDELREIMEVLVPEWMARSDRMQEEEESWIQEWSDWRARVERE